MLEEEEFLQADVFLSPPNEGLLSDEDSDDEEGVSAAHLSGPQLSATAEYRINYGNSVVNSLEFDASADEDAVTASTDVSDHDLSNLDSETEENSVPVAQTCSNLPFLAKKRFATDNVY